MARNVQSALSYWGQAVASARYYSIRDRAVAVLQRLERVVLQVTRNVQSALAYCGQSVASAGYYSIGDWSDL
jgi:outer membrane protein assembly factor BamD (BamD/ComL family)